MKKSLMLLIVIIAAVLSTNAQHNYDGLYDDTSYYSTQKALVTFKNLSDFTMTLRIVYAYGGHYSTVYLRPHSSSTVSFSWSETFKLKIKATSPDRHVSYHDGGYFSVTCTSEEWTEGEMTFQMSTYGSGIGPSISAEQFESND